MTNPCTIIVQESAETPDRAPFAGSRELFHACSEQIVTYLLSVVHKNVPREHIMSTQNCLRYLSGHDAIAREPDGRLVHACPPATTPHLRENAIGFLREWFDEEEWSDDGEPAITRYVSSIDPHVQWILSFTRICIPIGREHMLVLRPHQRETPTLTMDEDGVDDNSTHSLMTICKRGKSVDVKECIGGHVDFVVLLLTTRQFIQEFKSMVVIPDNVSHVLTVMFGNSTFHALIRRSTHRRTLNIWRCVHKPLYYLFEPAFLLSQLFVEQ